MPIETAPTDWVYLLLFALSLAGDQYASNLQLELNLDSWSDVGEYRWRSQSQSQSHSTQTDSSRPQVVDCGHQEFTLLSTPLL